MMEDSAPGPRLRIALLGAAVAALVYAGYRLFWFLTDDAFIAYRYIANRQLGFGYVWNPPPFLPVEGYTSFLWVVLLDAVWSVTGVEPPRAANVLALVFGYGTLVLVARLVWRMDLPPALARHRLALVALVLLGTATNRTFLTWLSSGLETALFNFCLTLWLVLALARPAERGPRWIFGLSLAATLAALARPDGYLALGGTVLLLALHLRERGSVHARELATAFPLLGAPLHVLWRRATYGEWLPNTYYAKFTAPWPESGLRYAASFVLEYAVWVWLALALAWLVRRRRLPAAGVVAVGVLVAHSAYYTLAIGGDHFEYRVYSHLAPLLFASCVWLAARLGLGAAPTTGVLGAFVVLSWPIPWVHWQETRAFTTREDTWHLFRPVAHRFPQPLFEYARAFDDLQEWLIGRSVCMRHQEHKVFQSELAEYMPPRAEGARVSWDGRPVFGITSVGMVAWRLPHVALIDAHGLNDYVVARTPPRPGPRRQMAHERDPPPGYVECFRPNVRVMEHGENRIRVTPRRLSDLEITRCEEIFRERVRTRGEAPRARAGRARRAPASGDRYDTGERQP